MTSGVEGALILCLVQNEEVALDSNTSSLLVGKRKFDLEPTIRCGHMKGKFLVAVYLMLVGGGAQKFAKYIMVDNVIFSGSDFEKAGAKGGYKNWTTSCKV